MACHTRSNSFTSRPHPIVQEVDEHLCRLRSSEATSTSSSSISHELSGLHSKTCMAVLIACFSCPSLNKPWHKSRMKNRLMSY
ncbi:hypothetical protein CerSpe_230390 [Prunus speciosa]